MRNFKFSRYLKYFSLHLSSQLEYRGSFLLTFFGRFFTIFSEFLIALFLVNTFKGNPYFTTVEMMICFSVVITGISLSELFFRGFDSFSSIISNGEYDRILLRPQNEIIQVIETRMDFARIAAIIEAFLVLIYCINASNIVWSPSKYLLLTLMILGAFIIYSGIYIISASICFITTESLEVFNILTDGTKNFGKYPFSVFGKIVLNFFTFIIPLSLVQVYPLAFLLDKTTSKYVFLMPFASIPFFIISLLIFARLSKRYKSIGA